MLVLTRRVGEAIVIGDNEARVTVLSVRGRAVRLGFEAKRDLAIQREEVYERIAEERECHCNIETGDLESLRKACPLHGEPHGE